MSLLCSILGIVKLEIFIFFCFLIDAFICGLNAVSFTKIFLNVGLSLVINRMVIPIASHSWVNNLVLYGTLMEWISAELVLSISNLISSINSSSLNCNGPSLDGHTYLFKSLLYIAVNPLLLLIW